MVRLPSMVAFAPIFEPTDTWAGVCDQKIVDNRELSTVPIVVMCLETSGLLKGVKH